MVYTLNVMEPYIKVAKLLFLVIKIHFINPNAKFHMLIITGSLDLLTLLAFIPINVSGT